MGKNELVALNLLFRDNLNRKSELVALLFCNHLSGEDRTGCFAVL